MYLINPEIKTKNLQRRWEVSRYKYLILQIFWYAIIELFILYELRTKNYKLKVHPWYTDR